MSEEIEKLQKELEEKRDALRRLTYALDQKDLKIQGLKDAQSDALKDAIRWREHVMSIRHATYNPRETLSVEVDCGYFGTMSSADREKFVRVQLILAMMRLCRLMTPEDALAKWLYEDRKAAT